jgi:hypothetical protein
MEFTEIVMPRWPMLGFASKFERDVADVLFLGHNKGKKILFPLALGGRTLARCLHKNA